MNDLDKFEEYLKTRVSQNTVRVYMYALRQWFQTLNGNNPSQESAQAYVDILTKASKSPSTVNLRAHAIMRYFRWKGKQVRLDCPTIRIGEPEYLTMAQFSKVLLACNTALERALIIVLFDTAVRISELLNLSIDDIDWDYKMISVTRKGGRKEQVNISDKGLTALEEWIDARRTDSNRVFLDLSYWDAWHTIKVVGKRVGIPLHPHLFRHTRAIMMLMDGVTLHDTGQHLGHRNINTTAMIYGRFTAMDLKERITVW